MTETMTTSDVQTNGPADEATTAKKPARRNPKPKAKKAAKAPASKNGIDLASREKEIRKDYPRVLPGSLKHNGKGAHAGKLSVEIKCSWKGCKEIRRVATSDLFQVSMCPEHTQEARNQRRRKAAKK